jgi:DNA repair protein RecO (recombination protein O)
VIAKGVRKARSRKAGHLEPFTRVTLMMAKGRELDIVTQAEAIETFPHLRSDLLKLSHASYLVELLDRFTIEGGEANLALFNLLVNSLNQLASGSAPSPSVILYFELRLLELLGFRPELFRCVECGEEIKPEDQHFSPRQGGVVCSNCGRSKRDFQKISLQALKVMRHFQRSNFDNAVTPKVDHAVQKQVEYVMQAYIIYLLERRLNTPGFIKKVRDFEGSSGKCGSGK